MRSSLASYSRCICSTTSCESLLTSTFVADKARASSSLTKIASYFASLLDVRKLRWMTYSNFSPIGDCNANLIPAIIFWRLHLHEGTTIILRR